MNKVNKNERRYTKMKIHSILAIALLGVLLLAVMPSVFAQDSTDAATAAENTADVADNLTEDPGMTPDSSFYGLKTGWEKMKLAFTFNPERKAQLELRLAERKLLEVKKMAEKGNLRAMERAQMRHDALIESAQNRLSALDEDSKESKVNSTAEKVVGLQRALKAHENRIEVLKDILANENLSEEARAAIESAVAKMENKTAAMEQKLQDKKDKIKTKLRALTAKTASEVDDAIERLENKTGLTDLDQKIAQNRIEKTEEALKKLKERISDEKYAGLNLSAVDAHIAEAEATLADAKVLYAEGKYSEVIVMLKPISNFGRNLSVAVKEITKARLENRLEEVKNLIENAKEKRIERVEAWKNLSEETREEIKDAVRSEIRDRLQNREGSEDDSEDSAENETEVEDENETE
jgi:hypothetical protein